MVKLLVSYGDLIIEDDLAGEIGITTAMLARRKSHVVIAEFLEETQKNRHQRLKSCAEFQSKCQLFMLGLFFDKNSTLHNELGQYSDISHEVVRKVISFGNS